MAKFSELELFNSKSQNQERNIDQAKAQLPHLVYVVTSPMSAKFLLGDQLTFMRDAGFRVTLIASPGALLEQVRNDQQIEIVPVAIEREISLIRDAKSLFFLIRAIRKLRPDIVNASTPKAGLLGMMAAWITRVPIRIYLLRGLRLETTKGIKKSVLAITERIASACANHVVCISDSLRGIYVEHKLASKQKTVVLGAGSSNGIDMRRFSKDAIGATTRLVFQEGTKGPVIGFVGRLTHDKGILDLINIYQCVLLIIPSARLLLVGDFEIGDPIPDTAKSWLQRHPQVSITGFVDDVRYLLREIDVLAMTSHREGFGNAVIEAAAMEIPIVGFRVTGVVDAASDGECSVLVPLGDVGAFSAAIVRYLTDQSLRDEHVVKAKQRVHKLFRQEKVWESWLQYYHGLISAAKR
ncbi:glycosyltransferase family 4 protein [Aporhodopirellula aestuarii]|uniref:Glycosyltransferase family 4 protein n=1 Tax=Aporhodopirellula aestuarii TaxID=2950107 RepID=A0ABT0UFX0_9BACT|nr:glycosyltransferase family 4 protein [Aporhodopirellula aestuarii]MCM2375175.1 glycosyltransferase family 4 protein [Aporhodopirellula aestuarii]